MPDPNPNPNPEAELSFLARIVRHDLREPLRAIQGFSRGIADRYADVIDEKGIDRLQRVVAAASRLDEMVIALGVYLEARALEPRRDSVSANELLEEVEKNLAETLESAGARLEIASDLPELEIDRDWARRAIENLIVNAIVFGAKQNPEVFITALPDRSGLVVRDTGEGFGAEPENVYPLFKRGVGREVPGLGAGLTIAKMIANRHGGDVLVRRSDSDGSEVSIHFCEGSGEQA